MGDWKNLNVLVTGGASFIGSHLVDALAERGACVRVADDFSSGNTENLREHLKARRIELLKADLRNPAQIRQAVQGMQIVFHLAAAHGGRGYVDLHQAACAENLMLDGLVFQTCRECRVEKIVYASSGCVYPNHLQKDPSQPLFLTEEMAGPPYDADNLYGWAKLMGEMTLRAFSKEYRMKTASCRYFTVYGPRGIENHAVIAMIARAFLKQDPFEVWGDGCLPENGLVISNPGIYPISSVLKGDGLLSSAGKYTRVTATMARPYSGELVTIHPVGILPVRLTGNHPVLVARCSMGHDFPNRYCRDARHRQICWVKARAVKRGDFVLVPRLKDSVPQHIILQTYIRNRSRTKVPPVIPLDEAVAYFLGWYTAEGSTTLEKNRTSGTRRIRLSLGPLEGRYAMKLAHIISSGFWASPQIIKVRSGVTVRFCSSHLAQWLHAEIGTSAQNKRVPCQMLAAPESVIRAYLEGLFLGDGSRVKNGCVLASVSLTLLYGVQLLLAKIGEWGSLSWYYDAPRRGFQKKGHPTISYGKIEWRPGAKHPRHLVHPEHIWVPVRETASLEYVGTVYNAETEDNTYCTPFVVHNSQIRNWTWVGDIVEGTILAAEKINDGTAINLGTMERIRVIDAVQMVLDYTGHKPKIRFRTEMPTGPLNRVADNALAERLLGWIPQVKFSEGLHRTIEWYFSSRNPQRLKDLDRLLTERGVHSG